MTIERKVITPDGYKLYRDDVLVEQNSANAEGTTTSFESDQEPARGSEGGLLKSITVTLDNDQIKALPTTLPTLAEGADGKALLLLGFATVADFTVGYTNLDAIVNSYPTVGPVPGTSANIETAGYLFYSAAFLENTTPHVAVASTGAYGGLSYSGQAVIPSSDVAGQPIRMFTSNGVLGNFTGGHADNTLKITVFYVEVSL